MRLRSLVVAILLLLGTDVFAGKKPAMHRYKIILADGNQSIMEGTSIRSNGFYVEILIGKVVDTIILAPKYVTQLPDGPTEPVVEEKPSGVVPSVPEQKEKVASVQH